MKGIGIALVALLLIALVPVGVLAGANLPNTLNGVETMLYGSVQEGSILQRIERVEHDIYGETQPGTALVRIDRLHSFLDRNQGDHVSLRLQLAMAEWGFSGRLTTGPPLIERLAALETEWFGEESTDHIAERTARLMQFIWDRTRLDGQPVELARQTLVKIRVLNDIHSSENKVGDVIRYRVVEDVLVDGRLVIPVGAEGQGVITEVSSAGRLGRDGSMTIDFGSIPALDGSTVPLKVDEQAAEKNRSLELAAGASMAGILLLGPIGLAGGYFVRGRDVDIPSGTEFYVETVRGRELIGFRL